ncbi:YkgJ family cysteine cluster protein [Aliidiomarina sanyensis]|uniref:YkgJ family cysteine cluster protein n=1 Tax=Aliidiomarina sanyensis TaxID=1249555 RepID=A0A432WK75_9GAMM|nr:YkgJ family cysteine cluster protein [Aliidiomarina sanyensis]RUO34174.1 YkgJ family cysteine cluster protein [Aliidiomarina sanyensis]
MSSFNPCVTCGACCASFRVSFYWAEGDDAPQGFVPHQLTEQVNSFYRCMQGTNNSAPRCTALQGEIGAAVGCSIYANRPTPCREFDANVDGSNPRCDQARARWGLGPLIPVQEVA